MFLERSVQLEKALPECERALSSGLLHAAALGRGEEPVTLGTVGFALGPARIRKQVAMTFGEPKHLGSWVRVPISWKASPAPGLFPELDGYLQLEPVGPVTTKLSLRANYSPPLGAVGEAADQAVLHRAAEATARDFLRVLGARLTGS